MKSLLKLLTLILLLAPAAQAQERILFVKKSPYSTVIVTRSGKYNILKFRGSAGDVEESRCEFRRPWYLIHEYLRLQMLATAFVPEVKDALVVGLGGGSMSNNLALAFPEARVDSLELDPVVVEAARKYFGFREDDKHRAYVGDARDFLAHTSRMYDVIFLDAFDGLEIPEPLRTRQFYKLTRAHLKPSGVIVTNLHLRSRLYSSDRNTLAQVFSHSYGFLAMAQAAVVCQNGEPKSAEEILTRVRELQANPKLPYALERLARHLMPPADWDLQAPVLNDRV